MSSMSEVSLPATWLLVLLVYAVRIERLVTSAEYRICVIFRGVGDPKRAQLAAGGIHGLDRGLVNAVIV